MPPRPREARERRPPMTFTPSPPALARVPGGRGPISPLAKVLLGLVAPVLLAIPILCATARRFPLTPLLMILLAVHAVILMVGGHWTYARVPVGDWVRDALHLERNPYDRLGHLAQGFVPGILARELLLRTSPLRRGKWLYAIGVAIPLAFSAFYELTEWWTAVAAGDGAVDFLGSQGDVWDAQWDMFCALIGAALAPLLLGRLHDRQLARLGVAS